MTKQSTLHVYIGSNEYPLERRINFADVAWSEAERIARVGFWHGNRLYPPAAIRYIEVVEGHAEREKGCEYCGLIYKLDGESYGTDSAIIENSFCPMCGGEVKHE